MVINFLFQATNTSCNSVKYIVPGSTDDQLSYHVFTGDVSHYIIITIMLYQR